MEESVLRARSKTAPATINPASTAAVSDATASTRPPTTDSTRLEESAHSGDMRKPGSEAISAAGAGTPSWMEEDLFSGMGLLDLLVMVDAHLELFTRGIRTSSARLRGKADKLVEESRVRAQKIKLPRVKSDRLLASMAAAPFLPSDREILSKQDRERLERSYREFRQRADAGFKTLQQKWEEEKTVRLRDKVSFFAGVHNVLGTALLLGFAPTWIPAWYTIQVLLYLPSRVYTYRKRLYHYFLFDLCYAVNLLCLIYLWIMPGSTFLFIACYGLSMGSLGTAIATWRNSLVFHSLDKVTSLAIHIFPPLVFTTIRHFYPNAEARYPALAQLPHLKPWRSIGINLVVYLVWQTLYYRYVIVARKDKIAQGRATSFTFLINDRKRLIGRIAARVPPQWRESAFMLGQGVYTFVTLLLPIFVLYDSKFWSSVYLLVLFGFSTWSGGSFYLDVFARKFEKELIALRKEFAEQQALISRSSTALQTSPLPSVQTSTVPSRQSTESLESVSRRGSVELLEEPVESEDDDGVVVDAPEAGEMVSDLTGKQGLGIVEAPL